MIISDIKGEKKAIRYRFVKQYNTKFGEALFVSGNIKELGEWKPHFALKMVCDPYSYWTAETQIPVEIHIQFKYFVATFEFQQQSPLTWIGNENSRLKIRDSWVQKLQQSNRRELKIMSFNVRFQNQKDKNEISWASRKDNCVEVILDNFPDIVGVQQPKSSQRQYLMEKIGHYYNYFGKPRNLVDDEQSGIFIRRDKFRVIEDGYIWINENKTPGKKGFGARLPRYFTYLVVIPFQNESSSFMVFNTHLDHQTPLSKLQGIKYIAETIKSVNQKHGHKIQNVFVTGDFNTSDDDTIFKQLVFQSELLKSMRYSLPSTDSDNGCTFNGFTKMLKYIDKAAKFCNLDPGATIDHIFFRCSDYKPISFSCLRNENKIISDHYPIIGTFSNSK